MTYITKAAALEAIVRAHSVETAEGITGTADGTYQLVPTWVGNVRVWMAYRIRETVGYEVAYDALLDAPNLDSIEEGDRIGYWRDPETGEVCLDRTLHIVAPGGVALDIARLYNQKAIWSWAMSHCIEATDPATAL